MTRYFIEVMYDGTAFHGSQIQNEIPTVQLELNKAISTLLRKKIDTLGASRTDEGVHALANYYQFDVEENLMPQFHYKLNAILPFTIAVNKIFRCVGEPINARFDATERKYRYRIYDKKNPFYQNRAFYYPFKIDRNILKDTAAIIKEYQDFETFSKRNTQAFTFLCDIKASYWEEREDQLHYIVKANRFLRGMVRGLVGTQLQVARGKISFDNFRTIIESKDCNNADFSVAGHGLYLEEIVYPEGKLEVFFTR